MQNNKFVCPHCNKEIDEDKKDLHDNYCLYTPKNEEFHDLIPCEFCNEFINFADYQEHISQCGILRLRPSYNYGLDYNSNSVNTINTLSNLFSSISNTYLEPLSNNVEEHQENQPSNSDLNYYFSYNTITSGIFDNLYNNSESNETNTIGIFDNLYSNQTSNNISLGNENNSLNIDLQNINNILETLGSTSFNFSFNLGDEDEYSALTELSNEIGNVEIGIENIDNVSSIVEKKELCPICKDDHDKVRMTLCDHYFCNSCLQTWLKNNKTCPICLRDFSEKVL